MAGHIDIAERFQIEESDIKCNEISAKKCYKGESQDSFCNLKRYSRYDLLSLRNGQLSIHYPHCALRPDLQALSVWTCRLRCELQYLGLWKVPATGNQYGNCSCNGSCQLYACGDSQSFIPSSSVNTGCPNVCYANAQQVQQHEHPSSSPPLGSKRAVRSRERSLNYQRCINTELNRAISPNEGSIHHFNHQVKTAFIDHRSISSAHLMPAFAKRRMGNVNSLHSTPEVCPTFANQGNNLEHLPNDLSDDGDSSNHFETLLKSRKDSIKAGSNQNEYHNYKSSVINNRMDKNEQFTDSQAGWMNLVKKINTEYSPSNNKTNTTSGINKKLIYERRIGSGRLVPRDVNWDIRAGNSKQIEKETSTPSNSNGEKDSSGEVEKLNHRNSTTRYSDTRAQERRLYDRRILNTDDSNGSGSKRYTTSLGDERNNFDSNSNHYQQPQHFTGQRSMSFRRREYAEHRDHRDFRDYRDQKDSRENRDQREQRDHKDEPEWFSEGPTSQHDTIELRGFEENDESQQQNSVKCPKIERKSSETSLPHNSSNINLSTNESADISSEVSNSNNTNSFDKENDNICILKHFPNKDILDGIETSSLKKPEESDNSEMNGSNAKELFFDNFLNIEALENTLIGVNDQTMPTNDAGTSRFSRWFFNNSSNLNSNDEFNPPTKEEPKLNKDFNECEFNSFMTFLKCNNIPTPELPKSLPSNVSALSVEELEARMRKMDPIDVKDKGDKCLHKTNFQTKKSENEQTASQAADINSQDVEAFRKLLDQLGKPRVDISMNIILPTSGHPLPLPTSVGVLSPAIIPNPLPQSNMAKQEYMMKIMHQQQVLHQQQNLSKIVPLQHHRMTQISPHQQQPGGGGSENLPLMSSVPHYPPRLVPILIGNSQKRIDVQHLIQCVVREELSRSFLENELKNPNIPPYTKDIISTVLKETLRCNTSIAGSLNNLPQPDSNESLSSDNAAPNSLMQSLARGEVSLNLLEHELNKLNNMSIVNENSTGVFKERSRCGTPSTAPLNVIPISTNGVTVPLPQVPAQQNSISTIENVCTIPSDQQAVSMLRSHPDDSSMHIPTQRELQIHTQAIMQNAIFKKKMEVEQHEAIRRRQEMHKQYELESSNLQHQAHNNSSIAQQVHQPPRHMNSPTPLAFTPTSVLRKMTAEKDTNSTQASMTSPQQIQPHLQPHLKLSHQQIHSQQLPYQHANQPRMILGGGNFQYMHQQHQVTPAANGSPQISPQQKAQLRNQPPGSVKWPLIQHTSLESSHSLLNNMSKPMGRPILKGPIPTVLQNSHPQNQSNLNKNTQSIPTISQMQKYSSIQQPRQIIGQQFSTHIIQHQIPTSQQNNIHQQQQQQLFQHQRSVVIQRQQIQQSDLGNHTSLPPPANHSASNDNNSVTNLNYQRDGGLSPTSNQLAQWFSPELLAQASAGKLPLLNMNQALSLEEFERSIQHSSTAVHN